jgi:CelD/BcsL family acetyltransferase involved in cellulose biosynthesis
LKPEPGCVSLALYSRLLYVTYEMRTKDDETAAGSWPILERSDVSDEVRVARAEAGLDVLRADWEAASAYLSSPIQRFDWIVNCAEVLLSDFELAVIAVGSGSSVAIAPLYLNDRGGSCLEMIGERQLFEATDFVYTPGSNTDALAQAVIAAKLPLRFKRIFAGSPVLGDLKRTLAGRALIISREAPGVPLIDLEETWLEPEAHLSAGRRSDLRRARRIAAKMGKVTYQILSPKPEELDGLLQEAYAVEAASWKAAQGSALALDAPRGEFFRRYAKGACEEGNLRLCFLRIDGRAAAMQIAIVHDRRLWLLKIGHDDAFARASPGTLLLCESIRYAAKCGFRSLEFLGVPEPWISIWTTRVSPCVEFRAYPFGAAGITAFFRDLFAAVLGRGRGLIFGNQ